jgi:hypothetical protein
MFLKRVESHIFLTLVSQAKESLFGQISFKARLFFFFFLIALIDVIMEELHSLAKFMLKDF